MDRNVVEQAEADTASVGTPATRHQGDHPHDHTDDDRIEIVAREIPVGALYDWAVRPRCGAVVLFSGTIRDHSVEGSEVRSGVEFLDYEAYEPEAIARMQEIAARARATWPTLGRIGIVHRIGRTCVEESSVVVVVSAPHRPEAFEAARYAIDALKSSVPIWKRETWENGTDWGLGAADISVVPAPDEVESV